MGLSQQAFFNLKGQVPLSENRSVYGHRLCLLFSKNSILSPSPGLLFFMKAGDFFHSKRDKHLKNVRCKVRGNFFAGYLCFRFRMSVVSRENFLSNTLNFSSSDVRYKVKRYFQKHCQVFIKKCPLKYEGHCFIHEKIFSK